MKSVHDHENSLWVGWPGIGIDEIQNETWIQLEKSLVQNNYAPVSLYKQEVENFYYGLANKCLWPLFHYFIEFSIFNISHWQSYVDVNQKFANRVLENISTGDTVWIHDYQLLLCPKMIKDVRPMYTLDFFYTFRFHLLRFFEFFLGARTSESMLGADLIGFHTFDYERHFLSSVKRILRLDVHFNRIANGLREVVVNTFPMGIDFNKFHNATNTSPTKKYGEIRT